MKLPRLFFAILMVVGFFSFLFSFHGGNAMPFANNVDPEWRELFTSIPPALATLTMILSLSGYVSVLICVHRYNIKR